jgi:hypothetical protein
LSDTFTKIDIEDDNLHVKTVQDVQPILDLNKELRNSGPSKFERMSDLMHVASIPMVVVEDWINNYGINVMAPNADDKKRIMALLNGEFKYLKTRDMKL